MAEEKKTNKDKFKLYFFFFLVISGLVILIFLVMIAGSFWNYYSKIWRIKSFYSQKKQEAVISYPQINNFDPVLGPAKAKVKVFEYSDFFCPACLSLQPTLEQIEKLYGNQVEFVYKGLLINSYPEGKNATKAAYCANEQNKFWEFKSLLSQNPTLLNQQAYLDYAKALNLNLQIFSACLSSARYESVINNNIADALKFNINSVPTIFVNNQKIEGAINFDILKNIIDSALAQP